MSGHPRRRLVRLLILVAASTSVLVGAGPAAADATYPVVTVVDADGGTYWRDAPSWDAVVAVPGQGVYSGDQVLLNCVETTMGGTVPPYWNNTLWYQATVVEGQGQGSGLVNDHNLATGTDQPNVPMAGVPACESSTASADSIPPPAPTSFYDTGAAVQWSLNNAGHLPLIQDDGDCTWFVSQALWAGGLPPSTDWARWSEHGVLGSDYEAAAKALLYAGYSPTDPVNPTSTATNANDLVRYLVDNRLATKTAIAWPDNTAANAQLGDLIAYDWDNGSDGTIDHVAAVTGFAPGTLYPTVTQHSPERINRYWSWSPDDNSWIQYAERFQPRPGSTNGPPTAYLIHIVY